MKQITVRWKAGSLVFTQAEGETFSRFIDRIMEKASALMMSALRVDLEEAAGAADLCAHCRGDIRIRNPKGYCDHLHYPENCAVCRRGGEDAV